MARPRGRSVRADLRARQLDRAAWEGLIDNWIFSERDRYILKRHVLDGVKYEKLNKELKARGEYELSDRRLTEIIGKGFDEILKHL